MQLTYHRKNLLVKSKQKKTVSSFLFFLKGFFLQIKVKMPVQIHNAGFSMRKTFFNIDSVCTGEKAHVFPHLTPKLNLGFEWPGQKKKAICT